MWEPKKFGREASDLKCIIIEHLEDPEVKLPESLSSNATKNKTLWFIHTEECKCHMDKKESLEACKKKLHSSIWGQCTQMMKNKLEAMTNYATVSVTEDPTTLVKNIKGVTRNFTDQRCATRSLWHAHKQFFLHST